MGTIKEIFVMRRDSMNVRSGRRGDCGITHLYLLADDHLIVRNDAYAGVRHMPAIEAVSK